MRSAGLLAEDGPRDIGAEFLATDGACGGALNGWAVLGRNAPATEPVPDVLLLHADRGGERGLTFGEFDRP